MMPPPEQDQPKGSEPRFAPFAIKSLYDEGSQIFDSPDSLWNWIEPEYEKWRWVNEMESGHHVRSQGSGCRQGLPRRRDIGRATKRVGVATYIPEPQRKTNRTWTDKTARRESSYRRNRRNTLGARGRRLQRLRSERVERSFAHLCDTGGGRRTWLRGLEKVRKRYMSAAMAHNLGRIMRSLIGAGKPRYAAVLAEWLCFIYFAIEAAMNRLMGFWTTPYSHPETNRRDLLATCA